MFEIAVRKVIQHFKRNYQRKRRAKRRSEAISKRNTSSYNDLIWVIVVLTDAGYAQPLIADGFQTPH